MEWVVKRLKKICREQEVNLIEHCPGHFVIQGEITDVHYWPMSKKTTAYVPGTKQGYRYVSPDSALNLANKGVL